MTDGLTSQRTSNVESVNILWHPGEITLLLITYHYFPVEKAAVGKSIIEGRDSPDMEPLSSSDKMSGSVIKQNVILQYICKYIARKHRENVITYRCSNFDAGLTTFSYVSIRGHRMDIPNESIDIPFRHGGELRDIRTSVEKHISRRTQYQEGLSHWLT